MLNLISLIFSFCLLVLFMVIFSGGVKVVVVLIFSGVLVVWVGLLLRRMVRFRVFRVFSMVGF